MEKLTQAQREQWAIDGYIRVEQALSPDQVTFFDAELDRIRQLPGWEPSPDGPLGHYGWLDHAVDRDPEGFMDRRVLLGYDQAFLDLMDASPVFDLITDIMGPYVVLSMTQAIVRPSNPKWPGYTHTDGGEASRRMRVTETSLPLAMKGMYLLSDITDEDSGNFTVFPGSHTRPFPD
ncbi:MAG: phytanoyl-CoA dioxygenase family protein, partial [Holophagales bacterium]|nr:phytanoyl-CoA dioxygenase family protein [Holophagales bacterium]